MPQLFVQPTLVFLPHVKLLLKGHVRCTSTCKTSCCPTILARIAGLYLSVARAVRGDTLTTPILTDYVYLDPHPCRERRSGLDEGIHRVARILHALEISAGRLMTAI